jgi:hypothetical protein
MAEWLTDWKTYKPSDFSKKTIKRSKRNKKDLKINLSKHTWPEAVKRWADINFQNYIIEG